MKHERQPSKQDQFIEEMEARQRNTVWPDTLLNGRSVDEFLWKGSPDAPLVKRIGAWVFGFTFMLLAVVLIEGDRETTPDRKSIVWVILAVACFFVGLKVFLNGFRRRRSNSGNAQ
jgi:peptidoglycan/LPS O-acetylase OafA/YrhL